MYRINKRGHTMSVLLGLFNFMVGVHKPAFCCSVATSHVCVCWCFAHV